MKIKKYLNYGYIMVLYFLYASVIISLVGLVIATYTDLKARIVPNELNYGLAVLGLALFGIQSIFEQSLFPLMGSILGLGVGFSFGWVLWKLGVFAGGDVKLFMGLGALNPLTPALIGVNPLTSIGYPIFALTLFIYSLVSFLPYGLFMVFYKLSRNKKFQEELMLEMKPKIIEAMHIALFVSAIYVILSQYGLGTIIVIIPTMVLWSFFGDYKKIITIIAIIIAMIQDYNALVLVLLVTIFFSVGFYSLMKVLFSTRRLFSMEIYVRDLKEGMIPAVTLYWSEGAIVEEKPLSLKEIISGIRKGQNPLREKLMAKKEIISSRKARGVTKNELRVVKRLAAKGLIPKKMLIKESMPFVPTMLLGYLLCLFLGDFVFMIILGVF